MGVVVVVVVVVGVVLVVVVVVVVVPELGMQITVSAEMASQLSRSGFASNISTTVKLYSAAREAHVSPSSTTTVKLHSGVGGGVGSVLPVVVVVVVVVVVLVVVVVVAGTQRTSPKSISLQMMEGLTWRISRTVLS